MNSRTVFLAAFIISVGLFGCSKSELGEPVDSQSFAGIDPDQKALPKDDLESSSPAPVTDVTLDGTGEKIVDGATSEAPTPSSTPESTTLPPAPSATPTIEELTPAASGIEAPSAPIEPIPEASPAMGTGPQKRYIRAWELNIRSQPNRFSKIVGRLNGGDEVNVAIHGGWAKLDDGKWIRSRWLVKNRPAKFVGGPGDKFQSAPKKKSKFHKKSKRRSRKSNSQQR